MKELITQIEFLLNEYEHNTLTSQQGYGYALLKSYLNMYNESIITKQEFKDGSSVAIKLLLSI